MSLEMKQIAIGLSQPLNDMLTILGKKDEIENLIKNTIKINLDSQSLSIIHQIISLLTTSNRGSAPVRILTSGIEEVLKDGKLDITDVPVIVKMVSDLFNQRNEIFSGINLRFSDIALVIKIIISILLKLNLLGDVSQEVIFRLIDSSLALLETSLILSNVKTEVKIKGFCCC